MVKIENLSKIYKMSKHEIVALDNVSINIDKGDIVALKGPSGSGKSTLLNLVGLLDVPTGGQIYFDNQSVSNLNVSLRTQYRSKYLGFIFQNYNLIPELNVYENIEIPLHIIREKKKNRKILVSQIIEDVGLKDHIRHRPGELSGGQQQRVAIARALVKRPPLVIADEPTANLDSKTGAAILELMRKLNKKYSITFIFATHDEMVLQFMRRVFFIEDGKIIKEETVGN